jgi:uncharacterized DUF497 family protein
MGGEQIGADLRMGQEEGRLEPQETRRIVRGSGHGICDPLSLTIPDPDHSLDEDRFLLMGESNRGRLLVVAHTEQSDKIRIINARPVTPRERKNYEES